MCVCMSFIPGLSVRKEITGGETGYIFWVIYLSSYPISYRQAFKLVKVTLKFI